MFTTIDIETMLSREEYELGTVYLHTRYNANGSVLFQTYSESKAPRGLVDGFITVTEHISESTVVNILLDSSSEYQDRICAAGKLRSFFYHAPIGVKGRKVKFVKSQGLRFIYELV